jgi:hypothetical protein
MKDWLGNLWQAVLLRTAGFERARLDPDAFLKGFVTIVAVALLAGLPATVVSVARNLQPGREPVALDATGLDEARSRLEQAGLPPVLAEQIVRQSRSSAVLGAELQQRIESLPTVLPAPLPKLLIGLGGWLSRPFANAPLPLAGAIPATWLGYGLWVLLAARLLGGRGDMRGFFGATAFFAVPHLLTALSPLPVVGLIAAAVAFVWGLVVYVKATAVSQSISGGRAFLAVVLPFLVAAMLVLMLLAVLAGFATVLAIR